MASIKIARKIIGEDCEPLMFAEEGQANQGDFNVAINMCKLAADAGADGIEFQLFLADDMYIRNDSGHALYRKRELSSGQIKDLILYAHEEKLIFQVAGLSPHIIDLCAKAGADIFCVNASDLTNPNIIDAVIQTGKPFWLATLMATLEEIDWAVNYALAHSNSDVGLLHGQHVMSSDKTMGVPSDLLQLDCINLFKRRYGLVTGFVDHTATSFVPAIAASKGANLIMKHLSPTTNWKGPDWVVCLDPSSWKNARSMVEYAWKANGESKEISQAEFKDRSIHRRSIYTARSLKAGQKISIHDLIALRPGKGGIDPRFISEILDRYVKHDLTEQQQIQFTDFE